MWIISFLGMSSSCLDYSKDSAKNRLKNDGLFAGDFLGLSKCETFFKFFCLSGELWEARQSAGYYANISWCGIFTGVWLAEYTWLFIRQQHLFIHSSLQSAPEFWVVVVYWGTCASTYIFHAAMKNDKNRDFFTQFNRFLTDILA